MRSRYEVFRSDDLGWLLRLVRVNSVSPLEAGPPNGAARAQAVLKAGALKRGMRIAVEGSAPSSLLSRPDVPRQVTHAAADRPEEFLSGQPAVVLEAGDARDPRRTLVINFHIDTVGPHLATQMDGDRLIGRGSVDAKGPGVAAILGVAQAFREQPALARRIRVMVASVPGEEGGAFGVYGTRWLVESGIVGRLMIFAEPTGQVCVDSCTAAMTAKLSVAGDDAIDDHPESGHNATLALGWLSCAIAQRLSPLAARTGSTLTIAGVHTGTSHNRVYGTGTLLLNISYGQMAAATVLAEELERIFARSGQDFALTFGSMTTAARLCQDWQSVVKMEWLKRDIPPLANRDEAMERLLANAGLSRVPAGADPPRLSCDAIWAGHADRYVAVCGPGSLAANGAHTDQEFVSLKELDTYAARIRNLVTAFAAQAEGDGGD